MEPNSSDEFMLVSKKNHELLKHSYKSIRIVMNGSYRSASTLAKTCKMTHQLQNSSGNDMSNSIMGTQKSTSLLKDSREINLKFYLILVTEELS